MKYFALVATLLFASLAFGQADIYGFGVSFNSGAHPEIAGTALYAHSVNGSGTYAFTVIDALPQSTKPFTVNTNISVGVAQKLFSVAKLDIFAPTAAGISFNGANTGWQWNTGVATRFAVKKGSAWHLMPTVRVSHSSVSNNSGYQPIIGLLISR